MGTTPFRRGIGVLMAVASISASVSFANAAGTINLKTTTVAHAPGSNAVVTINDDSASQQVTYFQFNVYYNPDQATPQDVVGAGQVPAAEPTMSGPFDADSSSAQYAAGLTKYITVIGDNGVLSDWIAGDLASITFKTTAQYTGELALEIEPSPEGQIFGYGFIDGNSIPQDINPAYQSQLTSYGDPIIMSQDKDGTFVGDGADGLFTINVTGTGFFSDGAGPAPDTVFTFNGTQVAATVNSNTQAQLSIPASLLDSVTGEYEDVIITASNGAGYTIDNNDTFTIVSRDKVYADDDYAGFATYKRVAAGKIAGANAFASISGGATNVNAAGTVEVAAGSYSENVNVTKPMTIAGAGKSSSVIGSTGTAYHQILMQINAANVTVSDLGFDASEYVGGCIRGQGAALEVSDCAFTVTGLAAVGSNRGPLAAGIFIKDWGTQGVAYNGANANGITLKGNAFSKSSAVTQPNAFARGMLLMNAANVVVGGPDAADANVSGEAVAYRDLDMRYGAYGLVQNNQFATNVDVNDSAGAVSVLGNTFGNAPNWLSNEAALTVRGIDNATNPGSSVLVSGNHFVQTGRALWVGGSKSVTIDNNDFTPAASISSANLMLGDLATDSKYTELALRDDQYAHILIDTRLATSQAYYDTNVVVSNNRFFDTAANGNAIQVKDLGANNPAKVETLVTSFAGNEFNVLSSSADNFVQLDGSYTGTIDLASGANKVDVGSGLAVVNSSRSLADLFTVEDHTFHKLDASGTGLVRWVAQNIYVTDLSDKIQRGIDAANAGDTVHVQKGTYAEATTYPGSPQYPVGLSIDKQVTVLGPNSGIAGSGARVDEATIIPGAYLNAYSTLDTGAPSYETRVSNWHPLVSITAPGVVFDGFAMSGENANLTDPEGPAVYGDLNLAVATGVLSEASNVIVQNNRLEKLSYIAMWSAGYYNTNQGPQFDNVSFHQNYVQNVQSDQYGYAYYFQGSDGAVTNNVAQNVRNGMQIQPYTKIGTIHNCSGNILQAWRMGLYYNYTVDNASAWSLVGNVITACSAPSFVAAPTSWAGIRVETQYANANGGLFIGNSVNGSGVTVPSQGIYITGSETKTDKLLFQTNTIENVQTGLLMDAPGAFTLNSTNEIRNTSVVAVDIAGVGLGMSNVLNGNNIHDNPVGIQVRNGSVASVSGNVMTGNAKQLAFSTDSTVNSTAIAGLTAADLEAQIVNVNSLTGKTYISAGMTLPQTTVVAEAGFVNVRNTIQGSIDASPVSNSVQVLDGDYAEFVNVSKKLRVTGRGSSLTKILAPEAAGNSNAVIFAANEIIFEKLGVYRAGTNPLITLVDGTVTLPSGTSTWVHQGINLGQYDFCIVQDCHVENFFNGVYFNNSNDCIVRRNELGKNFMSIQFANATDRNLITQNDMTQNQGYSIMFNFNAGFPTVDPMIVRDNDFSANARRNVYISELWTAASPVHDFSGNWFGTTDVKIDSAVIRNDAGNMGEIIDYNSWLAAGTDTDAAMGFQGDFSTLYIAAASPLAGTEDSHISDAVKLLADGALTGGARLINATATPADAYKDGVATVDKPVTIRGLGATFVDTAFNPLVSGQNGIEIAAHDVTITNLMLTTVFPAQYGTAINRVTGPFNNTVLDDILVARAGNTATGKYAIVLGQPKDSVNSTGNKLTRSVITNCDYAGVAVLGGETEISQTQFNSMSYQGIYAAPDGNSQGGTRPEVKVLTNTFFSNPVGVRFNTVGANSVVGSVATSPNRFFMNEYGDRACLGVSIEGAPATVVNNEFHLDGGMTAGLGSVGLYVWGTEATATGNNFLGSGTAQASAIGVVALGERVGPLANPLSSNISNQTDVLLTDNIITNLLVGAAVTNSDTSAKAAKITVNGANSIKNNGTGVLVDGLFATAVVNGNWIHYNDIGINIANATATSDFNGNSLEYAGGTPSQKYVVNTSANDYDISASTFNNVQNSGPIAATDFAKMWTVQANLVDALDKTGNGHLILGANRVYVPAGKIGVDTDGNGILSRADLVASNGDAIEVQAGSYGDAAANINHLVSLNSSSGAYAATITQPVNAELPSGTGALSVASFGFSGAGSVVVNDTDGNANSGHFFVRLNKFTGVTAATAIMINQVAGSANQINGNNITGSQAGIQVRNSSGVDVTDNIIIDNYGTGIAINKTNYNGADTGITPSNIVVEGNLVSGSGLMNTQTDPAAQNYNAYGIFAGSFGGTTSTAYPLSEGISIGKNTIVDNAATGVALWYTGGATPSDITLNTIENNGIWRKSDPLSFGQNTDGVKLKNSQNVVVSQNKIRNNVRNNVLVEGNAADTGKNVVITRNHLDGNVLQVANGDTTGTIGGGLMLQITSPQAATTQVDANSNWWGHVYGPKYTANATGRGAKIALLGGNVLASTWYGKQTSTNKWFALNDRDGDGVVDAHEDWDLSGGTGSQAWGAESSFSIKDSDGDGWEDGVEIRAGSDPTNSLSTPLDVDGNPATTDPSSVADAVTYGKSTGDEDGDRYMDFYEVAMGTDPDDVNSKPSLGRLKTNIPVGNGQVTTLRGILLGLAQFNDVTPNAADVSGYLINQDNADVNRDGVVSNADLVFMRRFVDNVGQQTWPVLPATPNP